MTYDEAKKVIATITYKPGWKFDIHREAQERQYSIITEAKVQDSSNLNEISLVIGKQIISLHMLSDMTKDSFVQFIRQCIHRREVHEADEFLRVDGEMVFNPHKLLGD